MANKMEFFGDIMHDPEVGLILIIKQRRKKAKKVSKSILYCIAFLRKLTFSILIWCNKLLMKMQLHQIVCNGCKNRQK